MEGKIILVRENYMWYFMGLLKVFGLVWRVLIKGLYINGLILFGVGIYMGGIFLN